VRKTLRTKHELVKTYFESAALEIPRLFRA
jgi:hypothetical protein